MLSLEKTKLKRKVAGRVSFCRVSFAGSVFGSVDLRGLMKASDGLCRVQLEASAAVLFRAQLYSIWFHTGSPHGVL